MRKVTVWWYYGYRLARNVREVLVYLVTIIEVGTGRTA
jgi:hypothetical protein